MPDLTLTAIRAVASLSATLGLIVLIGWLWKRYGQPFTPTAKTEARLHVLETKRLNQHTTLHLVTNGDTEHLIATTAGNTTVISSRSTPKSAKVKPASK